MHFGDAQWQKPQKLASAFVQQIYFILYIHALQVEMYFFCLWNHSADTLDVNKLLTLKEVSSVTYIYATSDIPNTVCTYSSRSYPDLSRSDFSAIFLRLLCRMCECWLNILSLLVYTCVQYFSIHIGSSGFLNFNLCNNGRWHHTLPQMGSTKILYTPPPGF